MLFGDKIKIAREKKGLKRKELAMAINVSEVVILYWEKGEREPSGKNLLALMKILNLTIEDFQQQT